MIELRFRLPPNLPAELRPVLWQAYLARSAEICPIVTRVRVTDQELILQSDEGDGPVIACVPWIASAADEVWMLSSTTLLPGSRPYDLVRELARGQLYRVRCAVDSWSDVGLQLPQQLHAQLQQAHKELLASAAPADSAGAKHAEEALKTSLLTGQALSLETCHWLAKIRQERKPVPLYLCWSANTVPTYGGLHDSFNGVRLPLTFDPGLLEGEAAWQQKDQLLAWWQEQGWRVCLGPIFDFASESFQKHWRRSGDWEDLVEQAELFLTRAVQRYRDKVQDWQVIAAANFFSSSLSVEDGLKFLDRLLRPVRQLLAGRRVSIGLAQPWGERAARLANQPIPLFLADWLARANLGITALDLELVLGCEPRGTLVRPPWSISQLLDLFSEVDLQLDISLGLPASTETDPRADPPDQEILVPASEAWQSNWVAALLDLALAHPCVQRITWLDATDAAVHLVPHGGLFDSTGRPRQVVQAFHQRRPPQAS